MPNQRVLFIGGGSIGHIAPSIAIAQALKEIREDLDIHFVVSDRQNEADFVTQNGFAAIPFRAPRLGWNFLWTFWGAVRRAHALLEELQPHVIFDKGGFVGVPLCFAARKRGIPIVLHESDAVSGWANWLVGRWAKTVCLGFKGSLAGPKTLFTGNPIRPIITSGSRQRGIALTGLSRMRPILLVLGGSQGALALNRAVATNLTALLECSDIIHITGEGKTTVLKNPPGYWQCAFAGEEYPHLLAAADLALSRAGAGTIAELAAAGLPAILVPLEGVAHDHQRRNTEVAVRSGGCILLEQGRLSTSLVPTVRHLIEAMDSRHIMSSAMRTLHHPEAARQIAEVIARPLA
ncbi:MAG: UDP-N-acetylglucosamine--N-acetylmuramyl-(pentapeptide) pyrophosphoryl-undecaprenol N-acetylglucosamine transferase [Candidatus Peregrinibacteria bacterium]